MREGRGREGGREDSCNTFSFESATNLPRATTTEYTLSWMCRRRRRGSHHGGRGSRRGYVESENETRRGGRGGGCSGVVE